MMTRVEGRKGVASEAAEGGVATLRVLVVHGPNLNLLGEREPRVYGHARLADINRDLKRLGEQIGIRVETFQSNSEGEIVTRIQKAHGKIDALLINPAGYTHTSVAIRDAILALDVPTVEVHLTNVYRREPMRHHSTIADVAVARIMGFGAPGYELALRGVRDLVKVAQVKRA
jgi:3-dehydroquinate dehydratase II